jgi:hypothetical protein
VWRTHGNQSAADGADPSAWLPLLRSAWARRSNAFKLRRQQDGTLTLTVRVSGATSTETLLLSDNDSVVAT